MSLSEVVQVVVSKETKAVSRQGFGTIIIVGPNATFSGRVQYYEDAASLALDLTNGVDDPEYAMATIIFSQSPKPPRVAIGRVDAGDANLTASLNAIVLEQTDFYMLCITSNQEADQDLLAAWTLANNRISAIRTPDADTIAETGINDTLTKCVITFDADLIASNVVDMDVDTVAMASVPFDTDHDTTMDDIVTALDAMTGVDAELYGDTLNRKIRISTPGGNVLIENALVTLGVTQAGITIKYASIGAELKDEADDRSGVFYHGSAATDQYPDAGFLGKIATLTPGSYTGAYKTLKSVSVTNLTPTNSKNAHDKNVNTYEELGNVNVVRYGTVASGEFYDIMIGIDWTVARMQEAIYSLLVNSLKVPYTEEGIASIQGAISEVLDVGIDNGLFSPHAFDATTKERIGGYVVQSPELSDITSADKIARFLQNMKFTAYLAGAIHKVKVDGVVTV